MYFCIFVLYVLLMIEYYFYSNTHKHKFQYLMKVKSLSHLLIRKTSQFDLLFFLKRTNDSSWTQKQLFLAERKRKLYRTTSIEAYLVPGLVQLRLSFSELRAQLVENSRLIFKSSLTQRLYFVARSQCRIILTFELQFTIKHTRQTQNPSIIRIVLLQYNRRLSSYNILIHIYRHFFEVTYLYFYQVQNPKKLSALQNRPDLIYLSSIQCFCIFAKQMETQRDRPVERNVQKQDVEEAEVDENKITNAFANILMKFQQAKQKDANQSVEELQQLTKTTPVSTTNPPVIQIEDESSQDFEKVTTEPKVNEVVLEPQRPKQIVEERLQIDLQEQKEQPKNGRLSKKTTKENFPKDVVVVENELIESEKPPLKNSSSSQNTMQFGLQPAAAPIKPKSKPSKEKANEVKQSKPSSKPIVQPPQNQESPALQTQQINYITYKDRKLVRVIPIIEIQLQDLDGTEQNELFYQSADNEALAFDQEEEQIEEEEPQHKIVDFQIEITLVAPQLTEKITRTAEEEPKEENKLQRMYVNKNEAMQPMPASKRQIKKSGKYQMPQQRISPKLNHQTNSTPVVSESNGALKHSKISTPPQDLPKQPSTRLSTSQLNGSVTNRMNLGSSTLLDIIQELFNLKVIGPGVHRQFYEYHSIRDIHDFLTKFKAGKLHKFDFSHFKFTILDHRRLTQLLLNMRPDKYYLGAINQRDGEIQQFLLNLYSLPGEDYYKLYSKIDNISQIKWWSKIVTANYDNLMENQAQQSLNKKKLEALNNVMNSVETKAEEQSNSIAMRSSTQERPKSTMRIVNEQQQVQKKMRESELGKIRNIVSNFGPKKQPRQVQQAKPDDSGVRMRKKIKFY